MFPEIGITSESSDRIKREHWIGILFRVQTYDEEHDAEVEHADVGCGVEEEVLLHGFDAGAAVSAMVVGVVAGLLAGMRTGAGRAGLADAGLGRVGGVAPLPGHLLLLPPLPLSLDRQRRVQPHRVHLRSINRTIHKH